MRWLASLCWLVALAVHAPYVAAQDFGFEPPAAVADPALPDVLRDLAGRVLPAYEEDNADRFFSTLSALQMVVGDPGAAHTSRLTLRERLQSEQGVLPPPNVVYDIYTQARAIETGEQRPFEDAYADAFRETLTGIDNRAAYELKDWFVTPTEPLEEAVQRALDGQRGKTSITLEEALALVRAWFVFDAYRSFEDLVRPLLAEDTERRYVFEEITIPVANNAAIAAALVRPRLATAEGSLPTLLEFTLDRSSRDAREAAAHGYASVLALARIAGDPSVRPRAPFESDGDDARAVIDWIAKQSWSDGRVGMHGSRYGGYVAWSAAKRLPPALRAIATSDPLAPGIDVPNRNRIFVNSAYRWVYGVLAPAGDELERDDERWRAIDEDWYRSGRSYREFPPLPGAASRVFRSWMNHPSYDRFWQKWLPFGDEFAKLDIPVLTITGYYSAGATAALYYFTEHHERAPNADHALLIGPFDESGVEFGASRTVGELELDAVARIDSRDARYAWFDHVLRGTERPAILSANVNYELVGSNEWRHEASLQALEGTLARFYLGASPSSAPHTLSRNKAAAPMALTETADLRDRSDAEWRPAQALIVEQIDPREGALFVTEPFEQTTELAGRFRGELDFTVNKYDVDLVVNLYELRADGRYVKLLEPAHAFRASYARDRVRRRLLTAGVRLQLPFQSERMIGRTLQPGSRLAMTLGVNKRADQQINYGGTRDVSEESIEDAAAPVRIRWHEGSYIEIPTREPPEAPREEEKDEEEER